MASKRGVRRRAERAERERNQLKESHMAAVAKVGQGSVADLILQRNRLSGGLGKPPILLSRPKTPGAPLTPPVTPAKEPENEQIITSEAHKKMIFDEAVQNRDFYLKKQAEDGNKKPWFRYTRKPSQYSEFVMLNARMAKELLDHIWTEGEGNRKVKEWLKDAYKRDIVGGRWIPSDESIGIDYNGVVYNGRHRMTALLESGKEWPFYMTFNALEEAKFTTDSGAKRNSAEKLKLVINTSLGNRTAGFCKAIMKGLSGKMRYTETEIAEFAHKWQDLTQWISEHLPIARAEVQAAIGKAYLWCGPEKIAPFCERIREARISEEGDPARALYLALSRAKINRINTELVAYKKTLAALDATVHSKQIQKLYERDEDIFQWQEGWELPPGSWWEEQQSK